MRVQIEKPRGWKVSDGQSIAVDGICSTVIESTGTTFSVQYMPETLSKTTANTFATGRHVNLERSLRLNQFVDGHLTQGHVDARVRIARVVQDGMHYLMTVEIPKPLVRYVAPHGSIALNGVSLTVARARGARTTVALIPHTLEHTNLGEYRKGEYLNLEVDVLARYAIHSASVLP